MYGYIYLTTCLINKKIYIGQHKSEVFDESYKGSGSILKDAFNKYGKENFKVELLCTANSFEELNDLEQFYIKKYNSLNRDIGYNIKTGGNQTPCPQYIKDKISKANKGKYSNHTYLHKGDVEIHIDKTMVEEYLSDGWLIGRSEKSKQALSKGYNYNSKGMLGKKQSDNQKLAASKACSYKRDDEQRKHYSESKRVENKFICLRTPDNSSTIRILAINLEKYLSLGYILCKNQV